MIWVLLGSIFLNWTLIVFVVFYELKLRALERAAQFYKRWIIGAAAKGNIEMPRFDFHEDAERTPTWVVEDTNQRRIIN